MVDVVMSGIQCDICKIFMDTYIDYERKRICVDCHKKHNEVRNETD